MRLMLFLLGLCAFTLAYAGVWLMQKEARLRVFEARYITCYDGNTCTFNLPDIPVALGDRVRVQVRGLKTPALRGQTLAEARRARDVLRRFVDGKRVFLLGFNRERGEYVADVCAGGQDAAAWMAKQKQGTLVAKRKAPHCQQSLALAAKAAQMMA